MYQDKTLMKYNLVIFILPQVKLVLLTLPPDELNESSLSLTEGSPAFSDHTSNPFRFQTVTFKQKKTTTTSTVHTTQLTSTAFSA